MIKIHKHLSLKLRRSVVARNVSDFILSTLLALFISIVICKWIGLDHLLDSLRYEPQVQHFSALVEFDLASWSQMVLERYSGLIEIGFYLVFTLFVVTSYVMIHLRISTTIEKREKKKSDKFQQYFSSVIISRDAVMEKYHLPSHNKEERVHLSKEDLFDVNNRVLLLKELRAMHSLVSGSEEQKLTELYYALGFVDELLDKFRNADWVLRAEAINEVAQFKVVSLYDTVDDMILDQNETVRQNALIAKMKIVDQPLSILEKIKRPLSVWEKHQIFLTLKSLPAHRLPSFTDLSDKYLRHTEFIGEMKTQFQI